MFYMDTTSPLHRLARCNYYYSWQFWVGGSNDAIIDVVFNQPDAFAPVNHDYASLFKGQAGIIVVDGPDGQPGKTLGLKDYNNNNFFVNTSIYVILALICV